MNEDEPGSSSEEVTTLPITPEDTRDDSWDNECHGQQEWNVPFMLPANYGIVVEVGDISNTGLATRLDDHPTDVRPYKTVVGTIWIQVGIGVTVMSAVTTGPPLDRALYSASSSQSKSVLQWQRGIVGTMGPQTVITRCNTKTSYKVPKDREPKGFPK